MAGTARGNRQAGRGAGGDISRRIDLAAENAVVELLRKRGVDATIIGEECGRIDGKEDGYVVMDGIDGTTNASRRIPFYCCSLAYATDFRLSAVTHAAVIDLATGDLYRAAKGRGAFCNGRRMRVRRAGNDRVIGMSTSDASPEVVRRLSPLMFQKNHIRQLGAIALEMCLLARGQLDACIDIRGKLRPTDIAAACLIVREAGGRIYPGSINNNSSPEELDAGLGMETRISLVATAHPQAFEELSSAGVFTG